MPFDPIGHDEPTSLCWLHGFTQTGQSAHLFRSILAARRTVLAPDVLRHGRQWANGGDLNQIAAAVLAHLPDRPVDLGGYSMGARIALHVALANPDRVRRLVLISATRGIADEHGRALRRERDEVLAERIEAIGAELFINEWLNQPMFANLPFDDRERAAREGQHAQSLASSLREAGTGTQRWLGDELRTLTMPVVAIAGTSDERFMREAQEISLTAPAGSFAAVPAAGHAVHLHQPAWSARIVSNFLDASINHEARRRQQDAER